MADPRLKPTTQKWKQSPEMQAVEITDKENVK